MGVPGSQRLFHKNVSKCKGKPDVYLLIRALHLCENMGEWQA